MKHNRNPLATAIHYALGAGVVAGLAVTAAPVFAQDSEEEAVRDRIVVTGSRLVRTDLEGVAPVTVIDREAIQASGFANVGDVLRNLNQADSLGLSNLTSSTNANDGTQTVSLRGLGSARTLVLVNGRRWLGLLGGQVDTTQIPVAAIERIEVLGDGASAIYGSDAVAGVINIILRTDFEGFELDAGWGQYQQGDGERRNYGVTFGHRAERGGAVLNVSKVEQDPVFAGDRSISEFPVAFVPEAFGSAFGRFGIFSVPGRGLVSTNPDAVGPGANITADDFIPFGNRTRYNFAPTNYLLTPSDRLTAFFSGDYQINDYVRFTSQFTYNKRKSVTQIAEVPIIAGFSGPQWVIPYSGDNVFNPFGTTLPAWGFRMPEPRRSIQSFDTYYGTFGLDGDFELADRFFVWDVSYSRGESNRAETGTGYVNLLRLAQGVGPSFIDGNGQAVCGTPENPTPFLNGRTCVPLNFFNSLDGLTPEMLDFVNQDLSQQIVSGLTNWQANLAGEVFELPAGMVGLAVGAERRVNTYSDQPDSTILAGINSNNFREPTQGRQLAEEFYAEVAIPLLSGVPGVQYLEAQIATRYSDFTNRGLVGPNEVSESFNNTSMRYGLLYRPFEDLMLRAVYADTFRAPSAGTLFQGGQEGFPAAIDPCTNAAFAGNPFDSLTPEQQARCFAQGVPADGAPQQTSQLRSLSTGNPLLQPEDGRTKTIGMVWTPSFFDGFDMTVDFWDVRLDDALAFRGAGSILNGCILDGDATDCGLIERIGATGEVQTVRTGNFNLASINIRGYDGAFNYVFDTAEAGRFAFRLATTYTSSARLTTGELSEAQNVVGQAIGAFGGPTWRWRANASVNWNYGDFGVTWGMRYLHSIVEPCGSDALLFDAGVATRQLCSNPDFDNLADGFNKVGAVTYHDLSGTWEAPWDGTVRVGVRNLFRKDPPFMLTPFANSFDQAYDIPGRFFFASYTQRF